MSLREVKDRESKIIEVCDEFHNLIAKLLKLVESRRPGHADIDRIRRLVSLCKQTELTHIIDRCQNKMWASRQQILDKNNDYFLNKLDVGQYIRDETVHAPFQYQLISLIKEGFKELNDKEKEKVWDINLGMLKCVGKYKLLTRDYVPKKVDK